MVRCNFHFFFFFQIQIPKSRMSSNDRTQKWPRATARGLFFVKMVCVRACICVCMLGLCVCMWWKVQEQLDKGQDLKRQLFRTFAARARDARRQRRKSPLDYLLTHSRFLRSCRIGFSVWAGLLGRSFFSSLFGRGLSAVQAILHAPLHTKSGCILPLRIVLWENDLSTMLNACPQA